MSTPATLSTPERQHEPSSDSLEAISASALIPDDGLEEGEALLGHAAEHSTLAGATVARNLVSGTGFLAQLGAWLLVALISSAVYLQPWAVFLAHPVLQVMALLAATQAVLVLQPTRKAGQRLPSQRTHAALNGVATLLIGAGVTVVEYHKIVKALSHFHSIHAVLGVAAAALVLLQSLFGVVIWVAPSLVRGPDRARALWRYHRVSGYAVFALLLASIVFAAQIPFSRDVLKLKLWAVLVPVGLLLVGIIPRIQKQKLGL